MNSEAVVADDVGKLESLLLPMLVAVFAVRGGDEDDEDEASKGFAGVAEDLKNIDRGVLSQNERVCLLYLICLFSVNHSDMSHPLAFGRFLTHSSARLTRHESARAPKGQKLACECESTAPCSGLSPPSAR